MSILCRTFGHKVSRSRLCRDPFTFAEHSMCKRCGADLVRGGPGQRWQEEGASASAAA
jgi:hypothetical protein